jgi:SSS family solute:Na+ symporter
MSSIDWAVVIIYLIGLLAVGFLFSSIGSARTMFAAGGQSPWWISGLSSFMTFFSAGTFVVWGGIAYSFGFVAVAIQLSFGVAAFIAGRFIAGRWHDLGVTNASDYIGLRFGPRAVRFYIWLLTLRGPFMMGAAVYAFCLIACPLIPLSEGNIFRDPATGNFSVTWAIILFISLVTIYTMLGGLWAVLVTDVLQFIVLMSAVLVVVPLWLLKLSQSDLGWESLPEGFMAPTAGPFTLLFLGLFVLSNALALGMEWPFAQRALCVPSARDARRSFYLFGGLYLFSPFIWMLPPILYRITHPEANPDEAYILACREVLPVGLLGLLIAAMFSATASSVSSVLNVLSGSILSDLQTRFVKLNPERSAVFAGRVITLVFGALMVGGALIVKNGGTVTGFVLGLTIISGALLAPPLWGFFSKRLPGRSIWYVVAAQTAVAAMCKFGLARFDWAGTSLEKIAAFYVQHERTMDVGLGLVLPFALLAFFEWRSRKVDEGWLAVEMQFAKAKELHPLESSRKPLLIFAWAALGIALFMLGVWPFAVTGQNVLLAFSIVMAALSAVIFAFARKHREDPHTC